MTATGHAIIGTIIAAKIGNPYLAIPLAFVSHIAADMIPHWDTATNIKTKGKHRVIVETLFDIALGFFLSWLVIIYFFPTTNLIYVIIMIFVSQSLDWLMAPYYFWNMQFPLFRLTYKFQKKFDNTMDGPWGIITQVVTLSLLLFFALSF